jgi:hypothetical protein
VFIHKVCSVEQSMIAGAGSSARNAGSSFYFYINLCCQGRLMHASWYRNIHSVRVFQKKLRSSCQLVRHSFSIAWGKVWLKYFMYTGMSRKFGSSGGQTSLLIQRSSYFRSSDSVSYLRCSPRDQRLLDDDPRLLHVATTLTWFLSRNVINKRGLC